MNLKKRFCDFMSDFWPYMLGSYGALNGKRKLWQQENG